MEKISPIPTTPTVFETASSPPAPAKPLRTQDGGKQDHSADLRLEIDQDRATGAYIYRIIDRETGKIVAQLPREQVILLRDTVFAEAGAIIRTSA